MIFTAFTSAHRVAVNLIIYSWYMTPRTLRTSLRLFRSEECEASLFEKS